MKKEAKKEEIFLDAELVDALGYATFRARLDNGHEFSAFVKRYADALSEDLRLGIRVRVQFSPYDMRKGEIIFINEEQKADR